MRDSIFVHSVRFSPARDRGDGLLGFVGFKLGKVILDGIAVRRTAAGEIVLSFPERTDRNGKRHPFIRPLDQAAREQITREVIAELRRMGHIP